MDRLFFNFFQQFKTLSRIPYVGIDFDKIRIFQMSQSKLPVFFYLYLVDVSDNAENTLNIDVGESNAEKHPCPKTITQSVVNVLRYVLILKST